MPGHKDWILKARGDLYVAKMIVAAPDYDTTTLGIAAYHGHQCAEKALKAFLVYYHQRIPKTHDLDGLLENCKNFDQHVTVLQKNIDYLSPFEMRTRYPDDQFTIDHDEALQAIEAAENVLKMIMQLARVST